MRTIQMLKESALEEARSSKEYALCAIEYRSSDANLSRMFHDLSQVEMDHSNKFQQHMERRFSEMVDSGFQTDEKFEDEFNHARKKIIMCQAEAKRLIDMYW